MFTFVNILNSKRVKTLYKIWIKGKDAKIFHIFKLTLFDIRSAYRLLQIFEKYLSIFLYS